METFGSYRRYQQQKDGSPRSVSNEIEESNSQTRRNHTSHQTEDDSHQPPNSSSPSITPSLQHASTSENDETDSEDSTSTKRSTGHIRNSRIVTNSFLAHLENQMDPVSAARLRLAINIARNSRVLVGVDAGSNKTCAVAVNMSGITISSATCSGLGVRGLCLSRTLTSLFHVIDKVVSQCAGKIVKIVVAMSRVTSIQDSRRLEYFLAEKYSLFGHGLVAVCPDVVATLGLLIPSRFPKAATSPMNAVILNAGIRSSSALVSVHRKRSPHCMCSMTTCLYSGQVFCVHVCGHQEFFKRDEVKAISPYWIARRALNYVAAIMRNLFSSNRLSDVQMFIMFEKEPSLKPLRTLDIAKKAIIHFNLGDQFNSETGNRLLSFVESKQHDELQIASFAQIVAQLAENGNMVCQRIFADVGITVGHYLKRLLARPRSLTQEDLGGLYCTENLAIETIDLHCPQHSRNKSIKIALVGGVFNAWHQSEHLRKHFIHSFFWRAPKNQPISVVQEPDIPIPGRSLGSKSLAYGCARFAAMESGYAVETWEYDSFKPDITTFQLTSNDNPCR